MLIGMGPTCRYLQRSEALLRSTITPPLSHGNNDIDRYIRLVYTNNGPEYWSLHTTAASSIRRARNLYYDQSFAEAIYRYMSANNAKAGISGGSHISKVFTLL